MSEWPLHQVAFVTDNVAVRALVHVSPASAQALGEELKRHAAHANEAVQEDRIKGVTVYAHAVNEMPETNNDPAWGVYALLKGVSACTYDLDMDGPPPSEQPFGLHDFKEEALELDARAARCAVKDPWDTWSFSFVLDRGGSDDIVGEVVMRLPVTLREPAKIWLDELRDWMESTRIGYDVAVERVEAQPVSLTLKAAMEHCQEILRTHAHHDHPWLTALSGQLSVTTAETRGQEAQQASPARRRSLRRS